MVKKQKIIALTICLNMLAVTLTRCGSEQTSMQTDSETAAAIETSAAYSEEEWAKINGETSDGTEEYAVFDMDETLIESENSLISEKESVIADLTWDFENGVLTIRGEGDMPSYPNPIASAMAGDDRRPYPHGRYEVIAVIIEEGITSIGSNAFYDCGEITSITIPDSVTRIESQAFEGCRSLTGITIPDGVTGIGYGAFCDCVSLTSITIPSSVTSIEGHMFDGCKGLTSITIPEGVTYIGDRAFAFCDSLAEITIPCSVTGIESEAFTGCDSLTSITVPDGVTYIGSSAFWYCERLTSVSLPDSLTYLGGSAFGGCENLRDIYYGGSESDWSAMERNSGCGASIGEAVFHYGRQ